MPQKVDLRYLITHGSTFALVAASENGTLGQAVRYASLGDCLTTGWAANEMTSPSGLGSQAKGLISQEVDG